MNNGGDDRKIVTAIVVAAGSGERLGAGEPKAFVRVGGITMLEHALRPFFASPRIDEVVVVGPPEWITEISKLCQQALGRPMADEDDYGGVPFIVLGGGATRSESVAAGLAAADPATQAILVHDVARPFVPAAVIDRVLDALDAGASAVIPARPVTDTIKRVDGGEVVATIDREQLRAVQTPQGFQRGVLVAAHATGETATDDASLVETMGGRVVVVDGSDEAFKITYPWDLLVAEAFFARQSGVGLDVESSAKGGTL